MIINRCQAVSGRRQLLRPWLEDRLNRGSIPGFAWVDKERQLFRIPWKHRSKNDWTPDNCTIFRVGDTTGTLTILFFMCSQLIRIISHVLIKLGIFRTGMKTIVGGVDRRLSSH